MTLPDLEARVNALELPCSSFVIFGSAPMLALGLLQQVGDIDILARASAWETACRLGTPLDAGKGDLVVRLAEVDIYNGWMGADTRAIFQTKFSVNSLPYAPLWAVLEYKRTLNRPKDKAHIALIETYLATH